MKFFKLKFFSYKIILFLISYLFFLIVFFIFIKLQIIKFELPYTKLKEKINKIIIDSNLLIDKQNLNNLRIEKEIDLTGDKINEALIDLGSGGAAIEDYIFITKKPSLIFYLIKVYNDVEIIKFKTINSETKNLIFTQGTGGAGRYGSFIGLLPKQKAIYQASYSAYNSDNDYCIVDYYKYNKLQNFFEYDKNLSFIYSKAYCSKICNNIPDDLKYYFSKICNQKNI
ncbi:MAG: hypothetical protein KatS3mg095_0867 [Candidatus Parcubacteria bacterium]|nr:MAG: hypothetical protein KatS3mg095_0867 [Candidatus Parcubacteria bacterium]